MRICYALKLRAILLVYSAGLHRYNVPNVAHKGTHQIFGGVGDLCVRKANR